MTQVNKILLAKSPRNRMEEYDRYQLFIRQHDVISLYIFRIFFIGAIIKNLPAKAVVFGYVDIITLDFRTFDVMGYD